LAVRDSYNQIRLRQWAHLLRERFFIGHSDPCEAKKHINQAFGKTTQRYTFFSSNTMQQWSKGSCVDFTRLHMFSYKYRPW